MVIQAPKMLPDSLIIRSSLRKSNERLLHLRAESTAFCRGPSEDERRRGKSEFCNGARAGRLLAGRTAAPTCLLRQSRHADL